MTTRPGRRWPVVLAAVVAIAAVFIGVVRLWTPWNRRTDGADAAATLAGGGTERPDAGAAPREGAVTPETSDAAGSPTERCTFDGAADDLAAPRAADPARLAHRHVLGLRRPPPGTPARRAWWLEIAEADLALGNADVALDRAVRAFLIARRAEAASAADDPSASADRTRAEDLIVAALRHENQHPHAYVHLDAWLGSPLHETSSLDAAVRSAWVASSRESGHAADRTAHARTRRRALEALVLGDCVGSTRAGAEVERLDAHDPLPLFARAWCEGTKGPLPPTIARRLASDELTWRPRPLTPSGDELAAWPPRIEGLGPAARAFDAWHEHFADDTRRMEGATRSPWMAAYVGLESTEEPFVHASAWVHRGDPLSVGHPRLAFDVNLPCSLRQAAVAGPMHVEVRRCLEDGVSATACRDRLRSFRFVSPERYGAELPKDSRRAVPIGRAALSGTRFEASPAFHGLVDFGSTITARLEAAAPFLTCQELLELHARLLDSDVYLGPLQAGTLEDPVRVLGTLVAAERRCIADAGRGLLRAPDVPTRNECRSDPHGELAECVRDFALVTEDWSFHGRWTGTPRAPAIPFERRFPAGSPVALDGCTWPPAPDASTDPPSLQDGDSERIPGAPHWMTYAHDREGCGSRRCEDVAIASLEVYRSNGHSAFPFPANPAALATVRVRHNPYGVWLPDLAFDRSLPCTQRIAAAVDGPYYRTILHCLADELDAHDCWARVRLVTMMWDCSRESETGADVHVLGVDRLTPPEPLECTYLVDDGSPLAAAAIERFRRWGLVPPADDSR